LHRRFRVARVGQWPQPLDQIDCLAAGNALVDDRVGCARGLRIGTIPAGFGVGGWCGWCGWCGC